MHPQDHAFDQPSDSVIARFKDHAFAEAAVRKLAAAGFDMRKLSLIGRGYHTEEQVVGFYTTGDRVRFWGQRGAFWGGLWGLFFGGVFVALPVVGPVVVLGYLATSVVAAVEGAVVVGGLSALGAALASIGVPKDSVLDVETELKANGFLVAVHGTAAEAERARVMLSEVGAARVDRHAAPVAVAPHAAARAVA